MELKILYGKVLVLNAKYNLCDKKPKPDMIKSHVVGWSIPDFCPVTASFKLCQNGRKIFSFNQVSKKMLSLFSTAKGVKAHIHITHDTGVSCFEGEATVIKK
jgi:hypothetical protein